MVGVVEIDGQLYEIVHRRRPREVVYYRRLRYDRTPDKMSPARLDVVLRFAQAAFNAFGLRGKVAGLPVTAWRVKKALTGYRSPYPRRVRRPPVPEHHRPILEFMVRFFKRLRLPWRKISFSTEKWREDVARHPELVAEAFR